MSKKSFYLPLCKPFVTAILVACPGGEKGWRGFEKKQRRSSVCDCCWVLPLPVPGSSPEMTHPHPWPIPCPGFLTPVTAAVGLQCFAVVCSGSWKLPLAVYSAQRQQPICNNRMVSHCNKLDDLVPTQCSSMHIYSKVSLTAFNMACTQINVYNFAALCHHSILFWALEGDPMHFFSRLGPIEFANPQVQDHLRTNHAHISCGVGALSCIHQRLAVKATSVLKACSSFIFKEHMLIK